MGVLDRLNRELPPDPHEAATQPVVAVVGGGGAVPENARTVLDAMLADEVAEGDRSDAIHRFMCKCVEVGLYDDQADQYLGRYRPARDKWRTMSDRAKAREVAKARAKHQHAGQWCVDVGCSSTPKWQKDSREKYERGQRVREERRAARPRTNGQGGVNSLSSLSSHVATPHARPWPEVDEAMFLGPVGRFALDAAPYTEADPVAVLVSALVTFGAAVNAGPYVEGGDARHTAAEYAVVVGDTARARKGTSWAVNRKLYELADPGILRRVVSGFGSGESVIDFLSPPDDAEIAGHDSRGLVHDPEFARVLKIVRRESSILGTILRCGWDGTPLESRSRTGGNKRVEHYHLAALTHITMEELRATLDDVEMFAGTGNRFLFVAAKRSKLLPEGGNTPDHIIQESASHVCEAIKVARKRGRLSRTSEAKERWGELYSIVADDNPPGILGAMTSRAEAHLLRLSLIYALTEGAEAIGLRHLEAAWALWRYCRSTVQYVFGDRTGDPVADALLEALRQAGAGGLDGSQQSALFGRHKSAAQLETARLKLEGLGLVVTRTEDTGGRPRVVCVAK